MGATMAFAQKGKLPTMLVSMVVCMHVCMYVCMYEGEAAHNAGKHGYMYVCMYV
jgi:hypothetical protein